MRERLFNWLSFVRLVQYGASALIFDGQGRVLLVKHRLRGGWEWPAGGGKLGELPERAVIREIKEETGVVLQEPRLVAVYARRFPGFATRFNFTFAEKVSDDAVGLAQFDQLELVAMKWVPVDEARQLLTPRLRRRFEAALSAWQDGSVVYLSS